MNSRHVVFNEKDFTGLIEKYPNLSCAYCGLSASQHTIKTWNDCYDLLRKEYELNSRMNQQVISTLQTFVDTFDVLRTLCTDENKQQKVKSV